MDRCASLDRSTLGDLEPNMNVQGFAYTTVLKREHKGTMSRPTASPAHPEPASSAITPWACVPPRTSRPSCPNTLSHSFSPFAGRLNILNV